MLDRFRSSFNGFDPRDVKVRDFALFLGVIGIMIFCGGGALVINQLNQQNNIFPTLVPTPTIELAPILPLQELEGLPTATSPVPTIVPKVTPKVISKDANTSAKSPGDSCIYSEAWINNAATPIPDDGLSEFQSYLCDNGYWDIGIGDWVNSKGDWGEDGSMERAFIKFNREGVIIDRKFFDLQGNKIPGPTN